VIGQLGTELFGRLRIGIEQVGGERMVAHVLSPFMPEEEKIVDEAVARAADAVESWLSAGMDETMNRYNRADEQTDRS